MADSEDARLDAYLGGEMSPSSQRALAQAALDDPELFEDLTSAAVVASASRELAMRDGRPRKARLLWMVAGAAAVAATVIALVRVAHEPSNAVPGDSPSRPSASTATGAAVAPAPGVVPQPVILSARLGVGRLAPEFRNAEGASRAPKDAGVVTAVADGEVTLDLGSIDGVVKGSEVQLSRGGSTTGRFTATTIFRDRSRGRITPPGGAQVGDRAAVPPTAQLSAVVEQLLSHAASGDRDAAKSLAARGVALSAAVTGAEGASSMNELAAVLIGDGEDAAAEAVLQRARVFANGITAVRVANNLAAVAARRGDVTAAESLYRSALTIPGSGPEFEPARRAIEGNLQALGTGR